MGKYKKSQILILSLIVVLLSLTPFLSSSIKPTHLYFIINILIIAVGAEAGLLASFPKPPDQEKKPVTINDVPKTGLESATIVATSTATKIVAPLNHERVVKQANLEKISTEAAEVAREVKRCCSSSPSIFFIGGGEIEGDQVFKDEEGGEVGTFGDALDGQELSTKADTFIRNFYTQLKMQREVSYS